MIILDTNQLPEDEVLDTPVIGLLRAFKEELGHDICLPEMVLIEHMAHYENAVRGATEAFHKASEKLRQVLHYGFVPELGDSTTKIDAAVKYRETKLNEVFHVLPTPHDAWKEGLLREARRQPPAKTTFLKPGSGGRDVVIWLTALAACKDSGSETYFISGDGAFSTSNVLHQRLLQDQAKILGDMSGKFHYHQNILALFDELAPRSDDTPDGEHIADEHVVKDAVAAFLAADTGLFMQIHAQIVPATWNSIGSRSISSLRRVEGDRARAKTYKIGKSIWSSARSTWQATLNFPVNIPNIRNAQAQMNFTVGTALLVQSDTSGKLFAARVIDRTLPYELGLGELIR